MKQQLLYSGWLLGRIVEVLRLRVRLDDVVAIPTRTVQRYLQGEESAKPQTRAACVSAFVEALFAEGALPADRSAAEQRALATSAFTDLLRAWDEAVGHVHAVGILVERWDHAHLPWVRLLLLDLSLRAAAYLQLTDHDVPSTDAWDAVIEGKGFVAVVDGLRHAGASPYPRDRIAADAAVAESTVDEWLRGAQLPQSESIEQLAHALARHARIAPERAVLELRVGCAATAFVRALQAELPRVALAGLTAAFASFVAFATWFMSHSRLQGEERRRKLWQVLLHGSRDLGAKYLLNSMSKFAVDQRLLADIDALKVGSWGDRIVDWYRDGDLRDPARVKATLAEMPEFEGVGDRGFDELFEVAARAILVPRPLAAADEDPSELQVLRITGDDAFKKANREQQYTWCVGQGQFDEAHGHALRLVQLEPTSAKYHLWLGVALSKLDRVDEAVAECRISAALDPTWCIPAAEVGIVLLDHGRSNEARDVLERLKRDRPPRNAQEGAHLAYTQGVARMRTHDHAGAIACYRRALEQDPEHAYAMDLLAHCLLGIGDRREGREWAKRAAHRGQRETLEALEAGLYDRSRS